MKKVMLFLILLSSVSSVAQSSTAEIVRRILNENPAHQNQFLELIESINVYDAQLSEINNSNVEKINGEEVPIDLCRQIITYSGESKIISTIDMNYSYILDLTQCIYTISEIYGVVKSDAESQKRYINIMSTNLGYLLDELETKQQFFISVEEYFLEQNANELVDNVKSAKTLFESMRDFYSKALTNLSVD